MTKMELANRIASSLKFEAEILNYEKENLRMGTRYANGFMLAVNRIAVTHEEIRKALSEFMEDENESS